MKIRKLIIAISAMCWLLQSLYAQDTIINLSLKRTCQIAIENNVDIRNSKLEKQKSSYQFKESQSKLYPQIDGFSSFNYNYAISKMVLPGEIFGQTGSIPVQIGTKFDWNTGFQATQILYNQSYFTSLKVSKSMASMSELTLFQKKEEVVYQVSQLYYLCQVTLKQMVLLKTTMENTIRLEQIAKLQSDNGVLRKVDYSRVSVNKLNLQTQIDNLNELYLEQLGLLKYLIGLKVNTNITLSDSLSFKEEDQFTDIPNFNNRIEMKIFDNQKEVLLLTRTSNKQLYLPTLTGIAKYYYQGQRNEFDYFSGGGDKFFNAGFIGLSLSVPLFDGFEKHYKIQKNNIELLQLENSRKNTSIYFTKEYNDAISQYNNCMNVLKRQEESIKIAEETYNVNLQGYHQQVVSLSDLLLSEKDLTEAKLSYCNALLQINNAILAIKKAKGELLLNY